MDLQRTSQEYAYITLANEPDPADVVQASVNGGLTWSTVTVVNAAAEVLLRGPDYLDDTSGMLITQSPTQLLLRVKSAPEEISRVAAVVFLY